MSGTDIDEVGAKPAQVADMLREAAMGAQVIPFMAP